MEPTRRSSYDIEGEIFDRCLNCRRTGDDIGDLSEIARTLAAVDYFTESVGPSKTLDLATEYLQNLTGQILMTRLHGHEAPYTQAEHQVKADLRAAIADGRRSPELEAALDAYTDEQVRINGGSVWRSR